MKSKIEYLFLKICIERYFWLCSLEWHFVVPVFLRCVSLSLSRNDSGLQNRFSSSLGRLTSQWTKIIFSIHFQVGWKSPGAPILKNHKFRHRTYMNREQKNANRDDCWMGVVGVWSSKNKIKKIINTFF